MLFRLWPGAVNGPSSNSASLPQGVVCLTKNNHQFKPPLATSAEPIRSKALMFVDDSSPIAVYPGPGSGPPAPKC